MAYQPLISVKSLLKTVSATNEPQENLTSEPDFEETLAKMLKMMQSKLDGSQALSFSGMTEEALSKLNITLGGSLKLKTDYKVRVAATEPLGMTEHGSSEGLYRHLCVLKKHVPRALVLSLEQSVPATTVKPFSFSTIGGYIDYTAIGISTSGAEKYLAWPRLRVLQDIDHTLCFRSRCEQYFAREPCPSNRGLCKTTWVGGLKNIIHGAVTDGHDWIFLVLKMDSNGEGAIYTQSLQRTRLMTVVPPGDEEISYTMCDVIAGIIGYWVEHSNENIGNDDWFRVEWNSLNRSEVEGLDGEDDSGEGGLWSGVREFLGFWSSGNAMGHVSLNCIADEPQKEYLVSIRRAFGCAAVDYNE
ncbi:hypothetical protein K443DRAFT_647776 [Laccaria amethystina LaAM-08-1]|uniref:Uncharacterized protein n=1 Tax=Laccaria amethystina LaAM-08-1 TaxID=1095629 RepID=A0A0C9WVR3_9AGAR|nr:hypothetical protein K443DRAFT_647776 [Laccaria amethystina LaAM-08-1]